MAAPHTPTARLFWRLCVFLVGSNLAWLAVCAAAPNETVLPVPLVVQPLAERQVLVVGASTDSFPYGYIGDDGVWTGFAGDLLNAVARVMNLRIQRVAMPGRQLHDRFRKGEFDFLQALSQTPDRESYAEFSVPFLTLQGAIFVQKRGGQIDTLADFNGRRFALVGEDSIGAKFLRDRGLSAEITYVGSTLEGLRLVESGDCAGVFLSQLTALSVIERYGLHNLAMFGDPLPNYDIRHCFALHRGDAQLLARLNEGLAILHSTGEFDQIHNRWFGRFTSPVVSRQQVVTYSSWALLVALVAAVGGLLHQRKLRHRISGQAAELATQEALLRTLYDNIPMAMCVLEVDPAGCRVLSVNRQAEGLFDRPAAQILGQPLSALSPDSEWIVHLTELLQRGLASHKHLREERRLPLAHKRYIFTLVPITPGAAGHARLCVLAEDVTERRNLDEEIAQSRKLRAVGELVGGIAHEFNNLLTPIMLKVGQIELDWAHDPALIAETRLIAEAVQRSSELTQRLLTFGRKGNQKIAEVHLGSIVNNCFSLLRLTMDRRIEWQQDIPPDLPPIYFSATDLNQIILNLVINARDTVLDKLAAVQFGWVPAIRVEAKLLPAGAMTRVEGNPSARQIIGWQRLTISDNGMGMPPEVRERIFEPFFTTKDVGKGTGLGLATVWHIVTAASGRIEVESTPGQGTAFHIYLPMVQAPRSGSVSPVAPVPAGLARARIFFAEDDALVAAAVTTALRRADHQVFHLSDGSTAWQHLQEHFGDYDLLILDVNMPGLDGIELARRVRITGQYTGRTMIASGRLGSDDLKQLAEARVDCIIDKPFDVAELLLALRKCLAAPPQP